MNRPKVSSPISIALLITAAGSSQRMGGEIKKEYRLLDGVPVLLHSLFTFLTAAASDEIVITIPPGDRETVSALLDTHFPNHLGSFLEKIQLVEGGATRQDSVRLGLTAFTAPHDIVLIHDGARPWISPEVIRQVIEATMLHGACIPVVPSTNAMKRIASDGTIEAHLPRAFTVGAQTPQAFRHTEIAEAHRHAAEDGIEYIDDSEIYHRYIGPVHTVPGDLANIKITFPSDLPADQDRDREPSPADLALDPEKFNSDPVKLFPDSQKSKSNLKKKEPPSCE